MSIYGYCRISRKTQNIERQVRNITAIYPTAKIIKEIHTGSSLLGRKELNSLIKRLRPGDTVVFDSACRMSRNAQEAIELYEQLYDQGISLVFLKEPHINTEVYKEAISKHINVKTDSHNPALGTLYSHLIAAINDYTKAIAREQIKLVFEQAEKELIDHRQTTIEGIQVAKQAGKKVGISKGTKLITQKSIEAKKIILKHSRHFGGDLTNKEVMCLADISENSFYKYIKELQAESH